MSWPQLVHNQTLIHNLQTTLSWSQYKQSLRGGKYTLPVARPCAPCSSGFENCSVVWSNQVNTHLPLHLTSPGIIVLFHCQPSCPLPCSPWSPVLWSHQPLALQPEAIDRSPPTWSYWPQPSNTNLTTPFRCVAITKWNTILPITLHSGFDQIDQFLLELKPHRCGPVQPWRSFGAHLRQRAQPLAHIGFELNLAK